MRRRAAERQTYSPLALYICKIILYNVGMKQKMAIAQAIMEKPELLILDEPTNGLDDEAVKNFQDIIREEKEKGTTCLIATHQKEDIMGLCDEVFEIKDGVCSKKIIEEGSSE